MSRRDEIVATAMRILEAEGEEALTMRRLADEIGIKAPSLYKHIESRDELIGALQAEGLRAFGTAFRDVLAAPTHAERLSAAASAYRALATRRPKLYRLTASRPLLRDRLPPGLEDEVGGVLVAVSGGDPDRSRALWALMHGLVDLELSDRFPEGIDIDRAWAIGLLGFTGLG
ncbi:MAG: TetR/AcrR family transcriptional regulator [Nocardioides sp.]